MRFFGKNKASKGGELVNSNENQVSGGSIHRIFGTEASIEHSGDGSSRKTTLTVQNASRSVFEIDGHVSEKTAFNMFRQEQKHMQQQHKEPSFFARLCGAKSPSETLFNAHAENQALENQPQQQQLSNDNSGRAANGRKILGKSKGGRTITW